MITPETVTGWGNFRFEEVIGRDIEQSEGRNTVRGPVTRISIEQDPDRKTRYLHIYVKWLAIQTGVKNWTLFSEPEESNEDLQACGVNMDHSSPYSIEQDQIRLTLPYLGEVIFLTPGDNLQKESLS